MKNVKLLFLACLGIAAIDTQAQCSKGYELSWADEFDSTAVNLKKWVPQKGGGGFGNQEIQYYQPENATVSDGLLHIKVTKDTIVEGSVTYNYSSAKLQTLSKATFQYGKMEARIKMPEIIGSWPAFWMLGANIETVPWPHCGEIDIVEWVGRGANVASGSIFFDGTWPSNHLTTAYNIPEGQSFTADFHTFAIEWEPNEIRYYCDGKHYGTYKNSSIAPKEWVFNHDFYLILNCAMGGSGGGTVVNFTDAKYMEVDYVRVYSLPSMADSIAISGPENRMENSKNVLYTTKYFPNTTYDWSLPAGAAIVAGAGTNAVYVNFAAEGGKVKVVASNTCGTIADSVYVALLADTCRIMYDNYDDTINVGYKATGALAEKFENPFKDNSNPSAYVAQYKRSITEMYDVLGVNDVALESALLYENGSRVFYMDLYTDAPAGTQITLQLESSALNGGAYPQGRRSSYIGKVGQQNGWHTVPFKFSQVISTGTSPDQIDHIALLFDPGHLTDHVYYLDNFKRLKTSAACGSASTGVADLILDEAFTLYPNPVSTVLYIIGANKSKPFAVYNVLGEKVLVHAGDSLDVSHLPAGMYLLKTENNTSKFIKE